MFHPMIVRLEDRGPARPEHIDDVHGVPHIEVETLVEATEEGLDHLQEDSHLDVMSGQGHR